MGIKVIMAYNTNACLLVPPNAELVELVELIEFEGKGSITLPLTHWQGLKGETRIKFYKRAK